MEKETLASEVIRELKRINKRRRRIIVILCALVLMLTAMVLATPRVNSPALNGREKVRLNSDFTTAECDFFRRACNFTAEERSVFDLRVKGKTNTEVAMKLCMSESTVDRRVKSIKKKIIRVL